MCAVDLIVPGIQITGEHLSNLLNGALHRRCRHRVVPQVAYSADKEKFRGCYQAALAALTLKQWGTVLGRVRRVLVPHLLYEPQRCRTRRW